ncbi:hypothetical protein OS493_014908 [Desmophyllum pertusum]|uniref:Major facilitator superfamily (MFS) profile domain-containing protein n=1 Tax=Desmophyllum pertusum TaxID=174260 RepID=A0A9W9YDQ2_9CNID|nr:hypothetical protein OS493_014908 [Desmophyllum pertusum]
MDGKDILQCDTEKHESTAADPPDSSATCHPSKFTFKAYFFLFFSAVGSSAPYLELYLKQLGMSAGNTGTLTGSALLIEVISGPLWGTVSDKFRIRKVMLFASLVSFAAGTLLLMAVQPQKSSVHRNYSKQNRGHILVFHLWSNIIRLFT